MTSKTIAGFYLIMWASTKFLPHGWAVAVYVLLGLLCLWAVINYSIKYFKHDYTEKPTFESDSVEEDEDTKLYKHEVISRIGLNGVGLIAIVVALCWPLFRSSDSELKKDIADVNRECPVTVDIMGEKLTYHSIDYDDDYIIVNIKLDASDPEYVDYVKNLENFDSQIRATKFGLVYNSPAPYKVLADKYHKGVKANYFFDEIGDALTITIPYDEMVQINATPREEAYLMELEAYVRSLNSYLPDTIVDGFYTSRIFIEGNNVVTELSFDDKKLDFNDYTSNPAELKRDADNALARSADQNDPVFMLNGLTARCGKGIINRIKTVYSNDSIDIVNTPEEVRSTFAQYIK